MREPKLTNREIRYFVKQAVQAPHSLVEKRGRELRCMYRGITENAVIVFETEMETTNIAGMDYWQTDIQITELDMESFAGGLEESILSKLRAEIARLLLDGTPVKMGCQCPAFLYWGYQFINTNYLSVLGEEERRFPMKNNPRLEGIACKHLWRAALMLPYTVGRIALDLREGNYLTEYMPATEQQVT